MDLLLNMVIDIKKSIKRSTQKWGYTKGDFKGLYVITILCYVIYRDVEYVMLYVSENPEGYPLKNATIKTT